MDWRFLGMMQDVHLPEAEENFAAEMFHKDAEAITVTVVVNRNNGWFKNNRLSADLSTHKRLRY
jgi:hypothetical protein